jgi:hypothetical protein
MIPEKEKARVLVQGAFSVLRVQTVLYSFGALTEVAPDPEVSCPLF